MAIPGRGFYARIAAATMVMKPGGHYHTKGISGRFTFW
jgi:hypothetical protein